MVNKTGWRNHTSGDRIRCNNEVSSPSDINPVSNVEMTRWLSSAASEGLEPSKFPLHDGKSYLRQTCHTHSRPCDWNHSRPASTPLVHSWSQSHLGPAFLSQAPNSVHLSRRPSPPPHRRLPRMRDSGFYPCHQARHVRE